MARKRTLDEFETRDLLDKIRGIVADGPSLEPPQIRDDLLKLHGLVKRVCQIGKDVDGELFALVTDLEDQIDEIRDAAGRILKVLQELAEVEIEEDDE